MSVLNDLTSHYMAGVDELRRAVAGMIGEQLKGRPIPGKWGTLEVVCHLADFDPILSDRMKRVIAEHNPQFVGADEKRFCRRLGLP
jgi:hypothetical protein